VVERVPPPNGDPNGPLRALIFDSHFDSYQGAVAYVRVIDAMAADGIDVALMGHTHGGQVRVPGYGALVTNSDLDRRRARGLSTHDRPSVEFAARTQPDMWLHVSAGLGTSPYAPIRFACPPEATLLTLTSGG